MIHLNVELWKIYQLCVLQVLNAKETIPARRAEKLAKVEMSRHNLECRDIISIEPVEAMSQQAMLCRNKE